MNYDLEQIDLYKQILQDLIKNQPGIKSVCIAGGAIRDMLLEKPIKDIDIFYHGTIDNETLPLVLKKKEKKDTPWWKPFANKEYTKPNDDDSLVVEEPAHYADSGFKVPYRELYYKDVTLPIQLIEVKTTPYIGDWMTDDFGCNISMVLMDGNGSMLLTQQFIMDATLQILTFKNNCNMTYRNKIIAKYPEYSCNGLGGNDSFEW